MATSHFDAEGIRQSIAGKLQRYYGVTVESASLQQLYKATASTVRDQIMQKWMISREKRADEQGKRLYYLSVEFLMGRSMNCNLINLCSQNDYRQALESLGEKLRKGRERLHPFGEQDGGEYIFLEPKDLLTFQDNGKYLVNNSFLLHGFYNYGHILLGTEAGDGMLILGVPGEFYIQEKLMASLFGFPEFRKTVDAYGNVENMGYWLRKMEE